MEIKRKVVVGSVESNDMLVNLVPSSGISINIESTVYDQYGADIYKTIMEVLKTHDISDVEVNVNDKGALDFTIKARLISAIKLANK